MSNTLIKVENVSKKFCRDLKRSLLYGLKDMGSEIIGYNTSGKDQLRKKEFWAVNDVSFEVKRGECLGLIGRNGAGKSTLLKMLNGLIKPDKGRIEMKGRVGALIELGAGFNPILTGRENIYINGAVLGMDKKEIDKIFDQIVDFSDLGEFIDTPVQYYSSGMKVRLGFSIASQIRPDVILIDEVLAVGDVGFKIKCYNEIYKLIEEAAVIFVSHSMPQIGKVCTNGMLLNNGKSKIISNDVPEVISEYYNLFDFQEISKMGNNKARVVSFQVKNANSFVKMSNEQIENNSLDKNVLNFDIDSGLLLKLLVTVDKDVEKFKVLYSFSDVDQKIIAQVNTEEYIIKNDKKEIAIETEISNLLLNTGKYSLGIVIIDCKGLTGFNEIVLGYRDVVSLTIKRETYLGAAPIIFNAKWKT